MRLKKFTLPCNVENQFYSSLIDEKVVIVSVFGKSQYRAKGCKTQMLGQNLLVDLLDDPTVNDDNLSEIEGYYDPEDQVIYLHLRGILDTHTIVNQYNDFLDKQKCKDFLSAWAHMRDKYARALLILFQISHIIILSHPTHTFDYSYVHLFRALDVVRVACVGSLWRPLSTIAGLPDAWMTTGRPCSPRVLFYFEKSPAVFRDPNSTANIKKLEHALEDQIYHILRKHRVVTNISSNSLFAIPANQEFVYINTNLSESNDIFGYMMNELISSCKIKSSLRNAASIEPNLEFMNEDLDKRSFRSFLQQHINLAYSKGFDDNVGRHTTPSHFKIPTISQFIQVSNGLFNFFNSKNNDLKNLHGFLDTDAKFSKSRCNKVLPRALQAYQDNLPMHYGRTYHETKLSHSMIVFEMHARGPLFDEYREKLEAECVKHWKSGRQMCEVLSLTGNPCTNPLHKGGSEGAGGGEHSDIDIDDIDLLNVEHCSGVRYICACNCGRYQGPRDDPYNLRHANYDWFQMLAKQCGCGQFDKIEFPVFQPSTHNYRAAQLLPDTKRKDSFGRWELSTPQGPTQACSLADSTLHDNIEGYGSGGHSELTNDAAAQDGRRIVSKMNLTPNDTHKVVIQVSHSEPETTKDKSLVRQPSTTEYLPGMLHTESPIGLLPQFSSWSLLCLGPSSLYSHNLGLQHQTGVLANSAFLLPWDVTVRLEHQKERGSFWPMVGDHASHAYGGRGKNFQNTNAMKCRKSKGGKEFVVKIFVGVEYECPRGHRFMASAPDKVLKATGNGIVKDSGNKVTSSTADMPLYFPCPCRQVKPLIAQLMRIHVVTPKAPVHVTLNPRVQPGPPPCPIFVTGCEEPIKLSQSAYWILRLPYVYMGEKGAYLTPKEHPVSISHGRLLAGMYSISEVVPEK